MEKVDYDHITKAYRNSKRRLFFLNYEGTLVESKFLENFQSSLASVNEVLFSLTGNTSNEVVVFSGQIKELLEDSFNYLPLTVVAENGGFFRISRDRWQPSYKGPLNWKDPVVHALSTLSIKYKGSSVEKKHLSVGWNYESLKEKVPPGEMRQFQVALRSLARKYDLKVHEHDHTIEFTVPEVSKGKFAANWVSTHGEFDFIMAIGDDWTDEDLFETIGRDYFTIKIGHFTNSAARYYLANQTEVIPFLKDLINRA